MIKENCIPTEKVDEEKNEYLPDAQDTNTTSFNPSSSLGLLNNVPNNHLIKTEQEASKMNTSNTEIPHFVITTDNIAKEATLDTEKCVDTKHHHNNENHQNTEENKKEDIEVDLRAVLQTLPRLTLEEYFKRTLACVQNLEEDLEGELERGQILEAKNMILNENIKQLVEKAVAVDPCSSSASSTTTTNYTIGPTQAAALLKASGSAAAAKVERASEAAAAFAVPLVKNAFNTFLYQDAGDDFPEHINDYQRTGGLLLSEQQAKRNGKYQCWTAPEETSLPKLSSQSNPRTSEKHNCNIDTNTDGNDISGAKLINKSPVSKEKDIIMDVKRSTADKGAKAECITPKNATEPCGETNGSNAQGSCKNDSYQEQPHSCTSTFENCAVSQTNYNIESNKESVQQAHSTSTNSAHYEQGIKDEKEHTQDIKTHNEYIGMAVILNVLLHLDVPPYTGEQKRLCVLATDSINECVEAFSRTYHLTDKQQASLTKELETLEEQAESFPVEIELFLSKLL